MAVVEADIAHAKISSSIGNTSTTYTVEYRVKCDTVDDGPIAILSYFYATPGLPYLGDIFQFRGESDPYAFVTNISSSKKEGSKLEWQTTVRYDQSSANPIGDDGNPTQNPLSEMKQYNLAFSPRQIPVEQAQYHGQYEISLGDTALFIPSANVNAGFYENATEGDMILPANSAGDAFDPPMTKDQSDLMLQCRVNLANYDGDAARAIQDKVNLSDMQLDLGGIYNLTLKMYRWQCKCVQVGANHTVREWYNAGVKTRTFYWEVSYEFHIRTGFDLIAMSPNGWSEWLVDRGYNRSAREGDPDGAGGVLPPPAAGQPSTMRIKGNDGLPISEPANLNGEGQPVGPTDDPRYLHFLGLDTAEMIGLPVGFTAWTPP